MDSIAIHKISDIIQKRKWFMSRKDKGKKYPKVNEDFVDEDLEEGEKSTEKGSRFSRELKDINITQLVFTSIIPIVGTIIVSLVGSIINSKVQSAVLESRLKDTNSNISELGTLVSTEVVKLENMISSEDIKIDALSESVAVLKYINGIAEVVEPPLSLVEHSTELVGNAPLFVQDTPLFVQNTPLFVQDTPISISGLVVKKVTTGEEVLGSSLVDKTIAFSYTDTETGELVFFKGQYDENGYWTGNCIIDKYNNGELTMIMDAEYNSGVLVSYKMVQAIGNEKSNDDGTSTTEYLWLISERKVENSVNVGETWTYFREESYEMKFDVDSFSGEDIISKDEFCTEMIDNLDLEGYYNGNTSDGLYNDTTGNACLVKYERDGYIRTFYVGNIVDGDLNDNTGKAIEIVFDKAFPANGYFYYIGSFAKGNRTDGIKPYYINQERIDDIVSQYDFNFEKRWRPVESE